MSKLEFSCTDCGACCVSHNYDDPFVDLTEKDLKRLETAYPRKVRRLVVVDPYSVSCRSLAVKLSPGAGHTVCEALKGDPGRTRVACTIYESRPSACSHFKPGSKSCRWVRSKFEDEAGVTLLQPKEK